MLKSLKEVKEQIELFGFGEEEGVIIFDNPDYATAFVGVTWDGEAVYDYDRMVEWLIENGWSEDDIDAADFISYNQSFRQPGQPIIYFNIE